MPQRKRSSERSCSVIAVMAAQAGVRAGIAKLRGMVEKEGRDPGKVALAYRVQKHGPEVPATAGDGERRLFSGTPAQIADDLKGLRDLGVAAVDLTFPGSTVEEVVASMRSFRDGVMARL